MKNKAEEPRFFLYCANLPKTMTKHHSLFVSRVSCQLSVAGVRHQTSTRFPLRLLILKIYRCSQLFFGYFSANDQMFWLFTFQR